MSVPSQLNITLTTSGNPVVNVPIPASLQGLDGSSSQQASAQTGWSAVDSLVSTIFKNGSFLATNGTRYPAAEIQSISWQ
jgi:hypothetical protein